MKTLLIMTSLGVLASAGALAAEVAVKGNVIETLEASDNYFLSAKPLGNTAKSNTQGTLNFFTGTPDTSYFLDTNYSYYKYFGPGAAETSQTWGTQNNVNFRANHVTELDKFNFAASWSRSDAAVTQLAQTGVANARGSINTYDVKAGVTHDLGRLDTLSWTGDWNTVSFTDPTQIPYTDVNSTILWAHTFSPTTTFTNSINFDWFSQDNAANSQRLLWRFTSGVQSQLTPRLSFNGQIGWIFANAYQNGNTNTTQSTAGVFLPGVPICGGGLCITPAPIFVPGVTPFQPLIGAGNGWIGNAGLSYRLLKDTSVSFTASQAVTPVFTGQLQLSKSLSTSLTHQINSLSNLSFFASYAETASPNGFGPLQVSQATATKSDFFSAGVIYSYQLAREWSANISYTFRENVTVAKSSTVLFSLSKSFTLLGNPTPIIAAENQRALQRAQQIQTAGYVFPGFQ